MTASDPDLVLRGVTIVDTRNGRHAPGMTIAISGGKIARIGDKTLASGAMPIDAHGKFVVPGYLDMHAHPVGARDMEGSLGMMLAHGITGVRQMSGSPDWLVARRAGKLMPDVPGPELLVMPGMILMPFSAPTPEAAVAEVRRQKEAGADFIKIVEVSHATFFAALEEAKRLGLPLAGHIPTTVSVVEAAKAGMKSVEHLFGSVEACSTDEAALLHAPSGPPVLPPIGANMDMTSVLERALANPILLRPPTYDREKRAVETFSAEKARIVADQFATSGTWQVPTLIRLRTMEMGDDPLYRNDPNLKYVPLASRQIWEALAQQFTARISAPTKQVLARLFALQSGLIDVFKKAGVNMAAGSDFGGGWCIPGAGLHQEFLLLAEAGLSPLDILQMTTLNGAKFLGREASMGTVEPGKNADLVVLDADPLADVRNLTRIHAVVRAGAYHSAAMLDALKAGTEARHSA
jgi:imidazolonepropionase-like amidohydrolase